VKDFCKHILADANKVLSGSKSLDYKRVARHDQQEIEKLWQVLNELDIMPGQAWCDQFNQHAHTSAVSGKSVGRERADVSGMTEREAKITRRSEIIEEINEGGFGDRVGKVYDSFAEQRVIALRDVPHRRGLPVFEVVVAPDFAPISGMHGIFISNLEVASAILAFPCDEHDWQVLNRKNYLSLEEMTEYVTLLSAGFELP
jgi:hypothetical protein